MTRSYTRLNIYLDPPELRELVRLAALRRGESASAWCLEAILRRLRSEGLAPATQARAREAAHDLDRIRASIGRLGVPVRELIDDGRGR